MLRAAPCVAIAIVLTSALVHAQAPRFSDQTQSAGLHFVHDQPSDHQSGPMGGGGAVGDFNADGYPDLFLIGGGERADALYINNGDGTFTDRAAEWGLDELHRGVGATVGDYDADGDDDLFVTSYGPMTEFAGPGRHRLYRNDGGRFLNVAGKAGVAASTTTHPDGYGAAFGDYDRDGDLDLFVGAWHNAAVIGSRLFRNLGDGTFREVSEAAGLRERRTQGFGAIWADMDGDRYPELLVAGDFGSNRYFRNDRDGGFTEIDPGSGVAASGDDPQWSIGNAYNAMGATLADFDRDGRPDWFVTAIWPTAAFESDFWGNGLYANGGNHRFVERAEASGVHDGGWGWGTEAVDVDHDGWTDLVMTNGWPHDDSVTGASFRDERAYLWRNGGGLVFEEVGVDAGLTHTGQGRALLTLDYDRDGDMDIVIAGWEEAARLYRNEVVAGTGADGKHWLQLVLDTTAVAALPPHGLDARVVLIAGGSVHARTVASGGSYLGQSERVLHFGLGEATRVDRLLVDWGSGYRSYRAGVAADQRLVLRPDCRPRPLSQGGGCLTSTR